MNPETLLEESQKLLNDTLNSSLHSDNPNTFYNTARNDSLKKTLKSSFLENTLTREQRNSLHEEFFAILQKCQSFEDVFDTIAEFDASINEVLCQLRTVRTKDDEFMKWLAKESNVWRLVSALYQYRLSPPPNDVHLGHITEKTVLEILFRNDPHMAECQLIIDWLEQSAADENDRQEKSSIEHFTDKTIMWENTLSQLKNNRELPFSANKQLVSSMEPDAPLKEKKHLHPLDEEDEQRLLKQVFREVRCGRIDIAQKLCLHVGQGLKASILEGWRPFHDPNFDLPAKTNERQSTEGHPNRDLWKLCAWGQAESPMMHRAWRATMGVLCGNLDAALLMCTSWEDILWAHLKVYVDLRVEEEIRANITGRKYVPMPDKYWNQKFDLDKMFQELENCQSASIQAEARQADREIQQHLILDNVTSLVSRLHEAVSRQPNSILIRLAAHLILVFRMFEQSLPSSDLRKKGDDIIKAYIKECTGRGNPYLVAYYVSHLNQLDQNQVYAEYLENVLDPVLREHCLQAAEENRLQIRDITNLVVEKVKQKSSKNKRKTLLPETTEEDLDRINAIDWITFYPEQRTDALWKTNEFVRLFVIQDKLEAAKLALGKISEDTINSLCDGGDLTSHSNKSRNASSIREYLCHKTYLAAEDAFNEWFHYYNSTKPRPLVEIANNAVYSERVLYESRLAQYEEVLAEWTAKLKLYSKTTKSKLYNVLLFPDGGWMVDQFESEESDRQQQMTSLRKSVIPKVVSLLYSLHSTMEEHTDILKIANIVVSEQNQLYKVYSQSELEDLLNKFADSSSELLKMGSDPWGFSSRS
uniref:Nuclear pore complex protein n=2 Tax=Cacopsylla melanoneura TaxID=428564 RepID=A0A8D9BSU8_9HEMI